jgi:hypothetical protein
MAQVTPDHWGPLTPERPKLLVCHDMMGGYLPGEALLAGVDHLENYRRGNRCCQTGGRQ